MVLDPTTMGSLRSGVEILLAERAEISIHGTAEFRIGTRTFRSDRVVVDRGELLP